MPKYKLIKSFIIEANNAQEAEDKFGTMDKKRIDDLLDDVRMEEIIGRPTVEEVIAHYKAGLAENAQCFTCGRELTGPLTDMSGQIRCIDCGTTYQVMGCHLKDEFLQKHGIDRATIAQRYCDCFDYIPLLKIYWHDVHKRIPFGTFIGTSPYTQEETDSFYGWLAQNWERFEKVYDTFNWDMLKQQYLGITV